MLIDFKPMRPLPQEIVVREPKQRIDWNDGERRTLETAEALGTTHKGRPLPKPRPPRA